MIVVKIPSFKYKNTIILQNINIDFESGFTYGVIGLNGAGKTTFFNLLAGLLKEDNCIFKQNDFKLCRKDIAFLDTDLFFYPKLTAKEFLSVFNKVNDRYNEDKLAELFKLPLNEFIEEYSTGMKKKLLILCQIKQDKDIYILDEPFNGLDLETNKIIEAIISNLNKRGKTVFISSHILDPLLSICHQIHEIKNQTIHKTYEKSEFSLIEENLFGEYKKLVNQQLFENI